MSTNSFSWTGEAVVSGWVFGGFGLVEGVGTEVVGGVVEGEVEGAVGGVMGGVVGGFEGGMVTLALKLLPC